LVSLFCFLLLLFTFLLSLRLVPCVGRFPAFALAALGEFPVSKSVSFLLSEGVWHVCPLALLQDFGCKGTDFFVCAQTISHFFCPKKHFFALFVTFGVVGGQFAMNN